MNTLSPPFICSQQLVFPQLEKLIIIRSKYDAKLYSRALFHQFQIPCPDAIRQAVTKRQAEYLAGRYCAKLALAELGILTTSIPSGLHRNPLWPPTIKGSITHTATTAFAATGLASHFDYIGIDSEYLLSLPVAREISPTIITDAEQQELQLWPMSFEQAVTLVFSAKESLFKALYPMVGDYFDFTAAEIVGLANNEQGFAMRLTRPLGPELHSGMLFEGYFRFTKQDVLTVIAGSITEQ